VRRRHLAPLALIATAFLSFMLAGFAGFGAASHWFIFRNYFGYREEQLTVEQVEREQDEDSTSWTVHGSSGKEKVSFRVTASRAETIRPAMVLDVWRNPLVHRVSFNGKSGNVIFAEEWKTYWDRRSAAWTSSAWAGLFGIVSAVCMVTLIRRNRHQHGTGHP
jgi:hypothetical protein